VTPLPPWRRRPSLVPLVRVHAANAAGDALIAVSLADTFFFDVPVGEARGRVALYLLVTMAPFAVVAPVIGPLLDRLHSGRRLALTASFAGRAILAWIMAGRAGGLALYPGAFGVLVLSKGYGIARAAAVPRLLPEGMTLVGANARLSGAALAVGAAAGGLGAGVSSLTSYRWSLRLAVLVFLAGAVFALMLPATVNSGHEHVRTTDKAAVRFSGRVRPALVGAASLRAFAGFLTMFLAFLLRREGEGNVALVVVVSAALTGGVLGTGLGAGLRKRAPEELLGGSLALVTVACLLAAWSFGVPSAAGVALASGLAGSLGKLAYDSLLQTDVAENVRGQVFARSETTLQLAWVAGGAVGIALPLRGGLGLGLAAAGLAAAAVVTIRALRPRHVT